MSKDIKLKVKLCAYTKGILPNNLIGDVDKEPEGHIYARSYGKWVDLGTTDIGQIIKLANNSGLNLIPTENPKEYKLSIRQEILDNLPTIFEDDTTYYIIENIPDLYINGGTAYSDGNNDFSNLSQYGQIINGGNAFTNNFDLILLAINSKGVNNGN